MLKLKEGGAFGLNDVGLHWFQRVKPYTKLYVLVIQCFAQPLYKVDLWARTRLVRIGQRRRNEKR